MNATGAEPEGLAFRHTRLVLGVLAALGALIAALAWLDASRSKRELEGWRERLCAELPTELVRGLDSLSRDALRAPSDARRALSVLAGLGSTPDDPYIDARILFESASGWRELRSGSDELGWTHDPGLLAAVKTWRCDAVLEDDRLRAVRPLQTPAGVVVLLVLERHRR